jgi:glutamate synthase domain-containing protein 1
MKNLSQISNSYNDDKVIANCGLFGMMSLEGRTCSGKDIIRAIANMRVRGNGLGGGFAAYGIYPNYADYYAMHIMYQTRSAKEQTESFLKDSFRIAMEGEVPHRYAPGVSDPPLVWRYFVEPTRNVPKNMLMITL